MIMKEGRNCMKELFSVEYLEEVFYKRRKMVCKLVFRENLGFLVSRDNF